MDEAVGTTRYWCHMCSEIVGPAMEVDMKCPTCHSGFIEEVEASNDRDVNTGFNENVSGFDLGMSLWAPLMRRMMGGVGTRPRLRGVRVQLAPRRGVSEESEEEESGARGEREREHEMNDRRRRSVASDSENSNGESRERESEREGERRERVILINHTIIVQGSYTSGENHGHGEGEVTPIGSIGDYFFGPSLDTLLQHLAENDPNRYGTPPAKKEAIDAMPIVKIQDNVQCSVCLEEFEIGSEAKEMPCKHKFHDECIKPWLELHSSCPVCRYQLPADELKIGASRRESGNNTNY